MDEEKLRRQAVQRRLAGDKIDDIAEALGRSDRWVRKWVARYQDNPGDQAWAASRSRAPRHSPRRTPDRVRQQVLQARARLVATPRAQYGALAILWELRRAGVEPLPEVWTVNRILAQAGVTRPRGRQPGYTPKGTPYPVPPGAQPGQLHQADLIGPRHLEGGIRFSAFNLIDVGTHMVATEIHPQVRPPLLAAGLTAIWARLGVPTRLQLDNHSTLRGGIPPATAHFGPVVATCLDLGVIPRFIPLREPWRNGVVEHFNDVWDKAFFRTTRFSGLDHLTAEAASFEAFHNRYHRYSAHGGRSPREVHADHPPQALPAPYQLPTRLPAKGKIEAIRFVRSTRRVDLWGHRITLADTHTYTYVTAVIHVRARELTVVTRDGDIAHQGPFPIARELR